MTHLLAGFTMALATIAPTSAELLVPTIVQIARVKHPAGGCLPISYGRRSITTRVPRASESCKNGFLGKAIGGHRPWIALRYAVAARAAERRGTKGGKSRNSDGAQYSRAPMWTSP